MKFTEQWLKSHLKTSATTADISDRLTNLGLEVEEIIERKDLQGFMIAEIMEAKPHPDAQRLQVCMVQAAAGQPLLQIVCGAPNARKGLKTVLGLPGMVVPSNGMVLKKSAIRGVESQGMLCSGQELKLSSDADGIVELPTDAPVGQAFVTYANLNDPVIHIAITPNRADCSAVYGVARDLAASGLGELIPLKTQSRKGSFKSPISWKIDLPTTASDRCPIVTGRHFRGLRNQSSPRWLQQRLQAIGQRPISALVDITNYLTYDLGRPLHLYDAQRLNGNLVIRLAKDKEVLPALDGQDYQLSTDDVVIADQQQVQGLAGIIGGRSAACELTTTEAFLEVAYFQPTTIARTGRRLNILSDARYRFERGVDPQSVTWGMDIATQMILDICGGEASDTVQAGQLPNLVRQIKFNPSQVTNLGGVTIPEAKMQQILTALGCAVAMASKIQDIWLVTPPSWRPDLQQGVDLVEEVLRVIGYQQIVSTPLPAFTPNPLISPTIDKSKPVGQPGMTDMLAYQRQDMLKRLMVTRGYQEALTYSFLSPKAAELFGGKSPALTLTNPITVDLSVMRPSLLPNLLQAAVRNQNRGLKDWAVFEMGPIFQDFTPQGQQPVLTGLQMGTTVRRHWTAPARVVDAFDVKGTLMTMLQAAGVSPEAITTEPPAANYYHPGRSGKLMMGKAMIGQFGEIHPRILQHYDMQGTAAGFELFLKDLPEAKVPQKSSLTLSPYQPVERDFALVVDANVPAEKLLRAMRQVDKQLIRKVELFDVYSGKGLADGKKSLAIGLVLQAADHTLTDEEITTLTNKILAAANKATGAVLRQ